jgi:hypothetical protein
MSDRSGKDSGLPGRTSLSTKTLVESVTTGHGGGVVPQYRAGDGRLVNFGLRLLAGELFFSQLTEVGPWSDPSGLDPKLEC